MVVVGTMCHRGAECLLKPPLRKPPEIRVFRGLLLIRAWLGRPWKALSPPLRCVPTPPRVSRANENPQEIKIPGVCVATHKQYT